MLFDSGFMRNKDALLSRETEEDLKWVQDNIRPSFPES